MTIYGKQQMNARQEFWPTGQMGNKLIDNEIFYCEPLLADEENLRLIQKFHVSAEKDRLYLMKWRMTQEPVW